MDIKLYAVGLYELWKTGRYKSYPPSGLIDLIARILALVPPWTRVYRVQRSVCCTTSAETMRDKGIKTYYGPNTCKVT